VGSFLTGDDAHPGRPAGQVHQTGELGDPRTVADLVDGVQGRDPDLLRDEPQQVRGVVREREPHRVGQASTGQGSDDLVAECDSLIWPQLERF